MQKFPLKKGLSNVEELHQEINEYIDVLMGHINPPISDGIDTLFEVSSTYLARAKEIEIISINVSPFFTELLEALKLITSAESLFSASSNDSLVLVEFSKNKFAIVISLSEGTFLIGLLMTSLKLSAVLKINSISSLVRSLIPVRF